MYENYLILISQFLMSRYTGMGDDLNLMQRTIENAQLSTKPVLSVMIISPLFGARLNTYHLSLNRLIFIRKKSQILHKNIEFLLVDLVSNQFIFIKSGIVTKISIEKNSCDPVLYKIYQNVLIFVDENKNLFYIAEFYTECKSIMHIRNINLTDIEHNCIRELRRNFEKYIFQLSERKIFSPYNVQTEKKCKNTNSKIFAPNTEHAENRTLVEWPTPKPKRIKSLHFTSLKISFNNPMMQYEFFSALLNRYNWNYIPYDRSLDLDKTFDLVGSSKYIIGPEGGICHLARMYGIPYVMTISRAVENIGIINCKMLKKLFYHWERDNYFLAPFEINTKDPSYFIFEKDLKRKNLSQLIDSIENFFENDQNQRIVFFTVNVNDPRTCAFVKQFCKAYDFEYGTDVQIYNPNNF